MPTPPTIWYGTRISTLVPSGTAIFTVIFKPSAVGTRTATIEIASNDADETPFVITLTGKADLPVPEIAVLQPVGSSLVDGKAKRSFGTVKIGKTGVTKTFIIKNTGTTNLTGLSVAKDGANKRDFIITASSQDQPGGGGFTTFKCDSSPLRQARATRPFISRATTRTKVRLISSSPARPEVTGRLRPSSHY